MAELVLVLIIVLFLGIIWMVLVMGAKSKGLIALVFDEPFVVFFVVVGTVLVILLVIIPLVETGLANLVVSSYLNTPVKI